MDSKIICPFVSGHMQFLSVPHECVPCQVISVLSGLISWQVLGMFDLSCRTVNFWTCNGENRRVPHVKRKRNAYNVQITDGCEKVVLEIKTMTFIFLCNKIRLHPLPHHHHPISHTYNSFCILTSHERMFQNKGDS